MQIRGLVLGGMAAASAVAFAQDTDIEWVTIDDVGNVAYEGDRFGQNAGRGSVPYEYRIGKLEVTTLQWMEFVNTFSTQSNDMGLFANPFRWGAEVDGTYDGPGLRFRLRRDAAQPEMIPVLGISWREAAMFCNWLHNGKSSDLSAIEDGAYDTSTFTRNPDGTYNDQPTRHPDAEFWIPSLDEWLKAAHYDPDKGGEGEGGWWFFSHTSDVQPVSGFPGEGETSTGLDDFFSEALDIPLGSYIDTRSPWGLLDTSGGTEEWTEEIRGNGLEFRIIEGAGVAQDPSLFYLDEAGFGTWEFPSTSGIRNGLRVASRVPSPGVCVMLSFGIGAWGVRRTRS